MNESPTPNRRIFLTRMLLGITAVALIFVVSRGGGPVLPWNRPEIQGTSMTIGDEFVIIDDGFTGETINWVSVRSWPSASSIDDRKNDTRFDCLAMPPTFRSNDGKLQSISPVPHVYFFEGNELTTFPIRMTAVDISDIHGHFFGMSDYREMLPLLKRFEVPQP